MRLRPLGRVQHRDLARRRCLALFRRSDNWVSLAILLALARKPASGVQLVRALKMFFG